MSDLAWIAGRLSRRRMAQETVRQLEHLRREPIRSSRAKARRLLEDLRREPRPHVRLGETEWAEPVLVPLRELVRSCGVMTGGMGSGKTMAACAVVEAIIAQLPDMRSLGFGVLDAKGELFDRTLYLLSRRLDVLDDRAQQELLDRIVVIDFSARRAVAPYNILGCWPYTDPDYFITSRLETLRELLPAGEKLSLRGVTVLKNALVVLSDAGLPLTYLDELLSSPALQHKLARRTRNQAARIFFERYMKSEAKQTIAALRSRMEALLSSEGVRLALSGSTAPDFRTLQNEGKIVLVNYSGPTVTRGVRLLLQGLVLSDIRQAVFARPNQPPVSYLWLADEAQNFFLTEQQRTELFDLLTMSRSFGSYFLFLCQNLSTSIPDARLIEQLHTNIRWTLTLRGTPNDARFLKAALPVTGRRVRPAHDPYGERTMYSLEEERSLLLDGVAHLPDRTGYLWLKARSGEAIKIRTEAMAIPEGQEFRAVVDELREEPRLGKRVAREEYDRVMEERDRQWLENGREELTLDQRFEGRYREEVRLWQQEG